jgi:adenylosuccinate lyase
VGRSHDYALFPARNAGHLDRRKQAPLWLQIELLASEALVKKGRARARLRQNQTPARQMVRRPARPRRRQRNWKKRSTTTSSASPPPSPKKSTTDASRWFHFGLTSSDVGDTAFAVQMVQSADILIADVKSAAPVIARRARRNTNSRPASAAATASTPSRPPSASSWR